jgi:GTPase SAR1 family protein
MDFSKLMDPFKLIESALNGVINAFKAWRGFKLLIFGTTGVGKTTLWQYLHTEKVVDPNSVHKTYEISPVDKFRLRSIKLTGIKVALLATDLPGDEKYRSTWQEVLYQVKPHGIIFMIDNVLGAEIPEVGFDAKRLTEHKRAFVYLTELVLGQPEVRDNLQALAIVANKSDTYPKSLGYGRLIAESDINSFLPKFNELEKCRSTVFSCSALYGQNVMPMMRWMVKSMAGESE